MIDYLLELLKIYIEGVVCTLKIITVFYFANFLTEEEKRRKADKEAFEKLWR